MVKYKIVKSEGCTSYATTINGKDIYDELGPMPQQEIDELVDYVCSKLKEQVKNGEIQYIDDLIKCFEYVSYNVESGSCETCGDSVSHTTWEI
jgi:hypothetical protein